MRHFRFFSTVLAVVVIAATAGLIAVDRVLRDSDVAHVEVDAAESALLVESFLAVHAEALGAFQGVALGSGEPIDDERFQRIVSTMREHFDGFRRVWVTDTTGVVVHASLLGRPGPEVVRGIDLDTLQRLGTAEAARRARATGRVQVSRPGRIFTGELGFAILQPILVGDRFLGFAGGTVAASDLLASLQMRHLGDRTEVIVLAGRDTVAARDLAGGRIESRAVPVEVLGGAARWRVVVRHSATRLWYRATVWVAGPAALLALLLGLGHERRQAKRIAERSRELEQLSVEVMRANRSKSEFLANVSHELRTPLNAIVGFTELLREGVYGELTPRQAGPVQRIEASASHLRVLVDQILDLAKMAAGRLEVHTEILDLRPFVLNVASELEPLVAEKNLHLHISVARSVPRVRTDPTHLRQILINLLGNAVKYTPSGSITVRARLLAPAQRGLAGDGSAAREGGGVGGGLRLLSREVPRFVAGEPRPSADALGDAAAPAPLAAPAAPAPPAAPAAPAAIEPAAAPRPSGEPVAPAASAASVVPAASRPSGEPRTSARGRGSTRQAGGNGREVSSGETSAERVRLFLQAPRRGVAWVALQVADTGPGIPKADQQRIFEEFEQVNAGPRGDSMRRGTGLGLPISRRLANLLGGDVTLESEPGKGSTFTLWIPVDESDLRGER